MKNYNQVEIILFSKYSLRDLRQKELARWLGTTAQHAIARQQEIDKSIAAKA